MSDAISPESLLKSRANPRIGLDYVVAHAVPLTASGSRISLRYVPDKLLVDERSLAAFLASLAKAGPGAPEVTALAILDELNNEIVPRWVQIAVSGGDGGQPAQTVIVEDRQPNWENPGFLERLPPL
jgi:hypothetical protein